ncbi:hypothetical protein AURDEDRAFT_140623 [Auricularia subglabra TFB-10046 SS5]|uniref:MYND-type domain-containing protein n=1 Tax=Auricularia subglabra (strain TFB-10046 / SS5) TaxID=717982 RepID=J0WNZ8_AURST|nr:hypothetical protein AURDEDRAFT_140623 [Auricularia subglabra TFB-10046 SS5]
MAETRMQPHWTVDRKAWNRAWEKQLKTRFALRGNYSDVLLGMPALEMNMLMSSHHLVAMQASRDELVKLQQDLSAYMVDHPDFEREWLATSEARRENFILEGLVRSCEAVADMEDRRVNTPETCLDFLQRRGGRGFLDLLAQIEDPPAPEPRIVPHAAYDGLIGVGNERKRAPAEKVLARMQTISRNFFLAMMVWNTVLAFHGESENYRATKRTKEGKEEMRHMKAAHPELYREAKEDKKGSQWGCRACGKVEESLPPGTRLLSCAKCNNINRVIKYCNKDCQKRDWPDHKVVCGKHIDAEEALKLFGGGGGGGGGGGTSGQSSAPADNSKYTSTTDFPNHTPITADEIGDVKNILRNRDDDSAFPAPVPPFSHSRYLKRQIKLLKENPAFDYFITAPEPHPDFGLALQHPMGQMMFLLMRRRAFESGERHSVLMIYKYIADAAKRNGTPLSKLREQLVLEYGVDPKLLENASLN